MEMLCCIPRLLLLRFRKLVLVFIEHREARQALPYGLQMFCVSPESTLLSYDLKLVMIISNQRWRSSGFRRVEGLTQGFSTSGSISGENRILSAPFKAGRKKIPCFLFGVARALPPASMYFNRWAFYNRVFNVNLTRPLSQRKSINILSRILCR